MLVFPSIAAEITTTISAGDEIVKTHCSPLPWILPACPVYRKSSTICKVIAGTDNVMVLLPPTAFEKKYKHCNQFTIRTCVGLWILLTSFRHIMIISACWKIVKILRKAQRDSWFLPPTRHQRTCFESNLRENVRKLLKKANRRRKLKDGSTPIIN